MMFKNSMKLFSANFDKVWKLLVYQVLSWAIIIALLLPFYDVIKTSAISAWDAHNVGDYFVSGTFYGLNVAKCLTDVSGAILSFVDILFKTNAFACIYLMFMLFVVRPILSNIGKYTICEMMYGYMSSGAKQSFTGTLLSTLGKSIVYACMKILYALPFNVLILLSLFGLTRFEDPIYGYILPFAIVIIPSLCLAFRETFIAGWAPAMIVYGENAYKAYGKGMRAVLRRGARVFSTAFIIFLLAIVLSMVLGLYALIIILPVIFPLIDILEMVIFFSSQGMRFYVDADTILSPKKLEEVDSIEKAKYLL